MAFFPQKRQDEQALGWALRLWEGVLAHRLASPSKFQAKRWASFFARLRREQGEAEVGRVLTWYVAHMAEEFCPKALTGPTFREKFPQIRRAMEAGEEPPPEGVGGRAAALARLCGNNYRYPVEVLSVLPALAQRTLDGWAKFCVLLGGWSGGDREADFLGHVLRGHAPSFPEDWLRWVSSRVGGLEHYRGAALGLAWKPAHPGFREFFWRLWSLGWSGGPTTFDGLLATLTKEVGK